MKPPKTSKKPVAKNEKAPTSKPKAAPAAPLAPKTQLVMLDISGITRDDTTQIRNAMDRATVDKYAEDLRSGDCMPAPVVFEDRMKRLWLADGHHTIAAHEALGHAEVECDVRKGSRQDAWCYAVRANARHGLRLSTADSNKILETALKIKAWEGLSNRRFAEEIGKAVSYETIRKARNLRKQTAETEAERAAGVRHGDKVCQPAPKRPLLGSGKQPPATTVPQPAEQNYITVDVDKIMDEVGISPLGEPVPVTALAGAQPPPARTPNRITAPGEDDPHVAADTGAGNAVASANWISRAAPVPLAVEEVFARANALVERLRSEPALTIALVAIEGHLTVAARQGSVVTLYHAHIVTEAVQEPEVEAEATAGSTAA